jgi:hypothetical protein
MTDLTLRFGQASAGWIPVSLTVDGREHTFDASHTPSDFLEDLAVAITALVEIGAGNAVLHEEPRSFRFALRSPGKDATLRVTAHADFGRARLSDDPRAAEVLVVTMPLAQLALALWRGLRELEGASATRLAVGAWQHPFPSTRVAQLGARLRKPRS